jgi:hypothetical protein
MVNLPSPHALSGHWVIVAKHFVTKPELNNTPTFYLRVAQSKMYCSGQRIESGLDKFS